MPSDTHAAFVVSNVSYVDAHGKYGIITINTLAMLQIALQMLASVGTVALQTTFDGLVTSEGCNSVLVIALHFDQRFLPMSVALYTHEGQDTLVAAATSYSIALDGGSVSDVLQQCGTHACEPGFKVASAEVDQHTLCLRHMWGQGLICTLKEGKSHHSGAY